MMMSLEQEKRNRFSRMTSYNQIPPDLKCKRQVLNDTLIKIVASNNNASVTYAMLPSSQLYSAKELRALERNGSVVLDAQTHQLNVTRREPGGHRS